MFSDPNPICLHDGGNTNFNIAYICSQLLVLHISTLLD